MNVAIASRPETGVASGATPKTARVAVLGASGYSGIEFARLALAHPGLEIVALASREHAGHPASAMIPGIDPAMRGLPPVVEPTALAEAAQSGAFDTLLSCLPHGAWRALAAELPALETQPARVIDLSADRRDGSAGYVYGLPEAFRAEIAAARRIANPGCYPTATTLAVLPAIESGWLEGPLYVSALSGVSGAGRSASLRTSFTELEGGASIYRAGVEHSHAKEMSAQLSRLAGDTMELSFVPHLVPMARGIVATVHAKLSRPVSPGEAYSLWCERYANEPFVRVLEPSTWPETRAVRGSNRCDVSVTTLHGGETLLVTAAIDNLVKGAAGQALQNLNLLLGWPETTGLTANGSPW
ncbi:MAG TPA: N-acetyl-gamma-glutamyl-phosphate reductase [Candidatus Eisenbacteria bacterium]|nr:N-acetyl-gamma-glutamyl-phosphate reductase [Candidatus Eisenbacteria bacterium]